jgi:hypothetical protein
MNSQVLDQLCTPRDGCEHGQSPSCNSSKWQGSTFVIDRNCQCCSIKQYFSFYGDFANLLKSTYPRDFDFYLAARFHSKVEAGVASSEYDRTQYRLVLNKETFRR